MQLQVLLYYSINNNRNTKEATTDVASKSLRDLIHSSLEQFVGLGVVPRQPDPRKSQTLIKYDPMILP